MVLIVSSFVLLPTTYGALPFVYVAHPCRLVATQISFVISTVQRLPFLAETDLQHSHAVLFHSVN